MKRLMPTLFWKIVYLATCFSSARIELSGFGTPALVGGPYELKPRGPCVVNFSAIVGTQKIELTYLTISQSAPVAPSPQLS